MPIDAGAGDGAVAREQIPELVDVAIEEAVAPVPGGRAGLLLPDEASSRLRCVAGTHFCSQSPALAERQLQDHVPDEPVRAGVVVGTFRSAVVSNSLAYQSFTVLLNTRVYEKVEEKPLEKRFSARISKSL